MKKLCTIKIIALVIVSFLIVASFASILVAQEYENDKLNNSIIHETSCRDTYPTCIEQKDSVVSASEDDE